MQAPSIRRSLTVLGIGVVAAAGLSGCIPLPPAAPEQTTIEPSIEPSTEPSPSSEPTTEPSTEPSTDPTADPGTGSYEYTADLGDGTVWSFEPTGAEVVPADAYGDAAPAGSQLVIVTLDADLVSGESTFYFDIEVAVVDDATGTVYGNSTGSDYIAENDIAGIGFDDFVGGEMILVTPDTVAPNHVLVTVEATGESWDFTVQ